MSQLARNCAAPQSLSNQQVDTMQWLSRSSCASNYRIAGQEEASTIARIQEQLDAGTVELESSYTGPAMETYTTSTGKTRAKITHQYIDEMRAWFKGGKVIARRHAWEIVCGAHEALSKEASLVEVTVPEGEVADVVGDTHGQFFECVEGADIIS